MNSKKAITLLVLVTLLVAMVPAVPFASAELVAGDIDITNDDDGTLVDSGEVGHLIIVEGDPDSVSSGYEVNLYWGKIQAWDGEKGLLNTTEVDDDGGFEIWFEVPEAAVGEHNIWYTATDQSTTARDTFDVVSDCDLSSSSGLVDSKVYVDLWGYDDNEDAGLIFVGEDPDNLGDPLPMDEWNAYLIEDEVGVADTDAAVATDFTLDELPYAPDADYQILVYIDAGLEASYSVADGWVDEAGAEDFTAGTSATTMATGLLELDWGAALPADGELTVTYWAFYNEVAEATDETYAADEDEYEGTALNPMIKPGTFEVEADNGEIYNDDDEDGTLYDDDDVDVGSVDYVTGEWSLDLGDSDELPAADDELVLNYEYFDDSEDQAYILSSSGITNDLGSWENKRITVPDAAVAQYFIYGIDGDGNMAYDDYEIGAIITLSEESGPVGSRIEIEGAGFSVGETVVVTLDGIVCHIIDADDDVADVDDDGEFVIEIIIPQVDDEDEFELVVDDGDGNDPAIDFDVTDLASVSVTPDFGPQGSTITVSGENFPALKDTDVDLILYHPGDDEDKATIDTAETDADGTFSIEVTVPTENDDPYEIRAEVPANDDGAFNIEDSVDFRIGTMLILLSKDESNVGDKIVLTGNGFTDDGEWNATFGDVTIFSEETVSDSGLIKVDDETPEFFVPQVMPGEYIITVWDVDAEIMVETAFTVTEYTTLEFGTYEAPNEFNLTVWGWYWAEVDNDLNAIDNIDFVLWNATDEWDMDVMQLWDHDDDGDTAREARVAELNATGFLVDGYWEVPDDDTLSKGAYTVNATLTTTNDQEYFMQVEFTVGDVHESVEARKATFRVGDTVSFVVEHSFGGQDGAIDASTITVYDPEGSVYWEIDGYGQEDWFSVDKYWTLKAAAQTDGGNPCVLLDDAPLGEWTFDWEDEGGDEILSGTFMVEDSEANVVSGQVADLANQIDELTADLGGVTEDFDDVKSDISGVLAVAEQAVAAANAATEAVNAVATQANNAGAAAEAAQAAAENAAEAASGLTTLVYGAIGAALVAALAAIVSLMQISRRIAG